jgi:glycosyltransferase involved in cell wall biosynthesis
MNLGIDARLLYNATGIGRYTRSLFFQLTRSLPSGDTCSLLTDRDESSRPDAVGLPLHFKFITAACPTRILWTNWHVPRMLRQYAIDVYHGVCNFELPVRKVCRYVVTIHDLVPLFFPQLVPKKHLLFFQLFMKRAAHTADLIITDSEHSKQDIVRHLYVPAEKIRVIYLGYDPPVQRPDSQQAAAILMRYNITAPYLLFVGVIEPKKNLERLVEAFALLRQDAALSKDLQLVIAGGTGWLSNQLYQKVHNLHLENQIRFTGYVPDADLPALYANAEVFVFPSIYEGFGLPVIEAMSYGVPVVTANVSSLPELAGNAGMLVDPLRPEAIAEGIAAVLTNPQQRARMQHAGPLQAQQFSWQRTAAETYKVYQEVYQM